jgi:hypothetical protein
MIMFWICLGALLIVFAVDIRQKRRNFGDKSK